MKQIILIAITIIFTAATTLTAAAERHKPGSTFNDCESCPKMAVLPSGNFMMGSPPEELGREDNEGPHHKVTINHSFAVGIYEVTFNEWDYCVRRGGCPKVDDEENWGLASDEGWGRMERPVINVSWNDAKAYVRWLSRETGKEYRLLTEAEWEYAARVGTTTRFHSGNTQVVAQHFHSRVITATPFHFGNTISTDQANYATLASWKSWWQQNMESTFPNKEYKKIYAAYSPSSEGKDHKQTTLVGSFPANNFGLHDMHGNVWEWVEDCWHDNYRHAPTDGSAWTARSDCDMRVFRGGSWRNDPGNLRSALRGRIFSDTRDDSIGFRVAMNITRQNKIDQCCFDC